MAPSFFSWTPTSFVSKIKNPLLYFNNNNNNPISLTPSSNDTTHVAIESQDQHDSSSPPNPLSSDRSVSNGASGGQLSASGAPERPSSGPSSSSSPSRSGSGSGSGSGSVPRVSSNASNLSEVDGLRVIFEHFDENNDGYLSGSELRTSLRMFGIETDDDEVAALVEEADTNNNGTLDFDEFVSFYYNLNQGMSLSKVPSTSGPGPGPGPSPDLSGAGHGVDEIESAIRSARIGDALGLGGSQISATPDPMGEESRRSCENGTTIGANSSRSSKDEEGEGEGEEDLHDAFDLFDKNGDGFICAEELQSVLSSMGLKQGKLLIDCQKMIRTFDLNGDGQISFDEFKQMMLIGFN